MTDRELLELAAKASKRTLVWGEKFKVGDTEVDCSDLPYVMSCQPDVAPHYWNPLAESDDAFWLAFKLEMKIKFYENGAAIHYMKDGGIFEIEEYGAGIKSARLCIVRAAAEIGKGMS